MAAGRLPEESGWIQEERILEQFALLEDREIVQSEVLDAVLRVNGK